MAESQYLDQVQELYIAYFGRPADPAGLHYWAQQVDQAGGNVAGVISGFSASAESQALYGAVTPADQVKAIYQNVFGRAPEPAGLAYWTSVIAGGGSASQMAFRVLQAAQGNDAAVVNNKVTAANAFTANIDTASEVAGYKGVDALAAARAFLSKVDASPASIANLAGDAAAAVSKATGTSGGGGGDAGGGGGGGGPPAVFTATKDAVTNDVTFANGTNITVALANGTYTFTSGGTSVPITGTVSTITVPSGAKLSIDLSTTDGITFPGVGTVALTDTAASAIALKAMETATAGLLDASAVTTITGSTSLSDAQLLLITNNGSTGDKIKTAANVTLTLGDTTADAAALKAIETHTTGLVDATGVAAITAASVADAKQLLVTDKGVSGDKINLAADVAVTLTDASASAADLKALEAATAGLIDAQSVTTITDASVADAALLISKKATTGDGINLSGSVAITLTDTTGDATALVNIEAATTGFVNATSLTGITGATAVQAQTLLSDKHGSSGDAIQFASDVAVTIDAGTATTTGSVLAAILAGTTGTIDASIITTINGISMATAELALVTRAGTVTLAHNVALNLSGTAFNASDLSTVEAATSGLVGFQDAGAGITVTGTLAQAKALYTHNAASGDAINMPALTKVILSDTGSAAAADLVAVETATSDLVTATGITSITGTLADIRQLVADIGTSGDHINLAANVSFSLTETSLSASDLNTLDGLTTSTVDFSGASNTVTGMLADVNMLLSHKVSAGGDGVNLADSVNISLRDGTLAAAALNSLVTQTTGLIDTTGNTTSITGTAADLMALYTHQATGASGVKIGANIPLTVSGGTANAADLNTLDTKTGGTVDFSASGNTITGTLADVNTLLSHKVGLGNNGVALAGNINITLSDASLSASDLNTLYSKTTGLIDISGSAIALTGSAAEMATLFSHQSAAAPGVKTAANVALTLDAGSANATDLNTLNGKTSGTVDFSAAGSTIVGTLADVNTVLGAQVATGGDGIKTAGTVNITLSDTTLAADDLSTLDGQTAGTVDFSGATNTVTGTLVEVNALLDRKVAAGANGVYLADGVNITLSNASLAATGLSTLLTRTTGLVDISASTTTLTGTAAAMVTLFTHQSSTAPGIKTAAGVTLNLGSGTAAASDLNTLDTKTSGTVDFSGATNTVTGTLADVNTLFGHKVTAGNNGVALSGTVNVNLSDASLAATAVTALTGSTSGLIDISAAGTLTGTATALITVYGLQSGGATGVTIAGNATLTLNSGSETAADLITLDGKTSGTVDFSTAGNTITGTLADVNTLLGHNVATGNDGVNIGNAFNATLRDNSLAAADIGALDTATSGLLRLSPTTGGVTITGTLAEVNALYAHNVSSGDGVNIPANASITLSDSSLSAADLNTLDGLTTGLISFSAGSLTLTGTLADINTLYTHNASSGNGVNIPAAVNITPSDTSLAADALNTLYGKTNGLINTTASTTTFTGSVADMLTLFTHKSATAHGINIAGNVTLTLASGTAAAADLITLDGKTSGTVVFSTAGNTLTGTLADVNTLFSHRADTGNDGVNLGGSVSQSTNPVLNITLSDSAFVTSDLATLNSKTSGLITLSASNATVTGKLLDIGSLYGDNNTSGSGNGINLGAANLVITDVIADTTNGTMTATGLRTRDDLTTGLISFANTGLTVNGFLDDFNFLYADNRTTGNGINMPGNLNLVISVFGAATTMAASDMVTLDGYTTGLVDATAITAITDASVAQAKQLLIDGVTNGQVSHKSNVAVAITATGSATAADLKAIEASTSGLVTATGITSITAASAADAQLLLVTDRGTSGDKINLGGAVAVTLSDTTLADASVLVSVDNATTGLVDASSVASITGTSLTDLTQLLVTNAGSAGNAVKWSGSEAVTLSGITIATADQLVKIDSATTGLFTATDITSITSASAADAFRLLSTDLGSQIALKADVAVTLAAGNATATQLLGVETHTTGFVDASAITSLSGSAADLKQLMVTDNGSSGDKIGISASVATTVTGTSALASDLIAIHGATSAVVNANAVTNITGSIADVQTMLSNIQAGTAITATGLNQITLTDAPTTTAMHGFTFTDNMTIVLTTASNTFSLADNIIAAGKTLTFDGSGLTSALSMTGGFFGTGSLVIKGGSGNDFIRGNSQTADTLTGGGGNDGFSATGSTIANMDTIKDYQVSGTDSLQLDNSGFSNVNTLIDRTGAANLATALNAAASANTNANGGWQAFLWGGDTYLYSSQGPESTAVPSEGLVKLVGTPYAVGTALSHMGLVF